MENATRASGSATRATACAFLSISALVAAGVVVGLCGCAANRLEERAAEREASATTLAWLEERYGLVKDTGLLRLVERIKTRLSSHPPESRAVSWQVSVIGSAEPNAFSAGQGAIVLTRALLEDCETEAQLAAVLAHEMSHQLLGHTKRALAPNLEQPYPVIAFSLQHELDADSLSVTILRHAGYDPAQALAALALLYRPEARVSYLPAWYQARLLNLEQLIAGIPGPWPFTVNTREYSIVRSRLRQ